MEAKRTAELNARLEKERVKKQLAEMDRKQLSVLSAEKKKFMNLSLFTFYY